MPLQPVRLRSSPHHSPDGVTLRIFPRRSRLMLLPWSALGRFGTYYYLSIGFKGPAPSSFSLHLAWRTITTSHIVMEQLCVYLMKRSGCIGENQNSLPQFSEITEGNFVFSPIYPIELPKNFIDQTCQENRFSQCFMVRSSVCIIVGMILVGC